MRSSLALPPILVTFDGEKENWHEVFGFTPQDRVEWLRDLAQRMLDAPSAPTCDLFVDQLRSEEITPELFVFLAAYGAQEYWKAHGSGFSMLAQMERESKDSER